MSDTNGKNAKLLQSKKEIMFYLGGIGELVFKRYIKAGMPARYEDGRWIAHADNLDRFFLVYTAVSMSKTVDEIPEG